MTGLERLAALARQLNEGERSDAAHAFRTPLAVIRGYAELLRLAQDEAKRNRAAAAIGEASVRLAEVVDVLFPQELVLEAPPPARARGESALVLVADNEEAVRQLLRMTLPDEGYAVIEAEDGVAAVELAAEHSPDLVLLDWNMPGGSGEEALRALKTERPEIAVIVMTGAGGTSAEERAESLGADGFLAKPFSPLALLRSIEALLASRRRDQTPEETARDTASRSSSAE